MSAIKKRNIAKLETNYTKQQEQSQLSSIRKKKALYRRLTVFFLIAGVVSYLMISTLISQNSALAKKLDEKGQLEKELVKLDKEEIVLKEEIVKLKDDDYIAKLARKEYFLSDEGEIIFTLPEDKDEEKTTK
jgi:cell division protein DivIC